MISDQNAVFGGSIPENYDRYLGPSFFEPFANDMVARLDPKRHQKVLEIACGTGIAIGLVRGNPVATAIEERGVTVDDVVRAVEKKIGERFGVAPVEATMQAIVCRALR